jgi:hypothetical protein
VIKLVHIGQIERIITESHSSLAHPGALATWTHVRAATATPCLVNLPGGCQIRTEYYGIKREMVQQFIARCPICNLRATKSFRAPLRPIKSDGPMSLIQVRGTVVVCLFNTLKCEC